MILVIQNTSSLTDVTQKRLQGNEFLGVFRFLLRMIKVLQEDNVHRDHLDDCREHAVLKRQERLHLRVQQLGKLAILRPQRRVAT